MISWLGKKGGNPDHPMVNVDTARLLLAELPKNDPFKALEEITSWLESFKDTQGYSLQNRFAVANLLDETGQSIYAQVLRKYLADPHLQDFSVLRLWQGCHSYMKLLAETYDVCLNEYQQAEKKPVEFKERITVFTVRMIQAFTELMKLDLMHYIEVEPEVWQELFRQYRYAEENNFANSMVLAHANNTVQTSPQRELLRALALFESSPGTFAAHQIEEASRITARLSSFFSFRETPDEGCAFWIDLAKPGLPHLIDNKQEHTSTMRYFGMAKAVPRLEELIQHNERKIVEPAKRPDSEFAPEGKLTVLKHLLLYWRKELPHRNMDRKGINTTMKVAHGFKVISKLVKQLDLSRMTNLSDKDSAMLKERGSLLGLADEQIDFTSEEWSIQDASPKGIGAVLPKNAGHWVKVGALCGITDKNAQQWWVGEIRRLHTDEQGKVHAGIAILAKKPLAVWLRVLGKGAERVDHWHTSSGSFSYDYLPSILLPGENNSYASATMLMQAHSFVPEAIYEAMTGEVNHSLKLAQVLAEGDDFEQVSFQWLKTEEIPV